MEALRTALAIALQSMVLAALLATGAVPGFAATRLAHHDPQLGPHALEERQHRHDALHLTPAPATGAPAPAAPQRVAMAAASRALPLRREVLGFAPYWALPSNANWDYSLLSTVAYFGLDVNWDGSFDQSPTNNGWRGWNSQDLLDMINRAHQAGTRVVLVIKAFDNPTINTLVTDPASTQAAITNTLNAIAAKQLDGVNVDFEGSTSAAFPNIQSGMTNFMAALSAQVHARWPNAFVSIDTYSGSASWDGGIFRIDALAPNVDAFFIMAYDMGPSNLPGQAAPNAPLNGWTYNDTRAVSQYLGKAPPGKIILGVPYYGYKASTTTALPYAPIRGGVAAVAYSAVLKDLACASQLTRAWDATAESPWAAWWSPASGDPCGGNHNSWRELYYDDAQSLGLKYDLVNARNLRGTGMWALGYDGTSRDLWQVLDSKFRIRPPDPPTTPMAQAGDASAVVSWTPPIADGGSPITSYTVRSSPGRITTWVDGSATSATVSALANGTPYTFTVTAANRVAAGAPSASSNTVTPLPPPGEYQALPPARLLDTRNGTGGVAAPLGPQESRDVTVAGQGGVPTTGVTAVVLNATVTNPTQAGYLTLYPAGATRPLASNVNFRASDTVANLVQVPLGAGGKVSVFNNAGSSDVILDVAGWVAAPGVLPGSAGLYRPVIPGRILDTRAAPAGPLGPAQSLNLSVLSVLGPSGVPASGVSAVVLNVTVTNPTAASFLTVYPSGGTRPVASNLNFGPNQTVANRVVVKVGTDGQVSLFNYAGSTHLVVDLGGWFTDGSDPAAAGERFIGIPPVRLIDTRDGTSAAPGPLGGGQSLPVQVAGQRAVPPTGVTAVVLNVTVTGPSQDSHLTVQPSGVSRPLTSDLNFRSGQTTSNLAIVRLGADGRILVYNASGATHIVIDLLGWYS